MVEYKCPRHNLDHIPEEVVKKAGITFPKAHTDKNSMATLARTLMKHRGDVLTKVPFCVTVEAEAFGAYIKMGDTLTSPRPEGHCFSSIEQLSGLQTFDIFKGRIGEVLEAVEILAKSGEKVVLNVAGPFTIIYSLIDPLLFFNGLRKYPSQIQEILGVIEKSVIQYSAEGIKRGASIISYEDVVGVSDIMGPEIYRDFSGPSRLRIINGIKEAERVFLIHLCGRTSAALEKAEMVKSYAIEAGEFPTYGQALLGVLGKLTVPIVIGHRCITLSPLKMSQPVLWEIK